MRVERSRIFCALSPYGIVNQLCIYPSLGFCKKSFLVFLDQLKVKLEHFEASIKNVLSYF